MDGVDDVANHFDETRRLPEDPLESPSPVGADGPGPHFDPIADPISDDEWRRRAQADDAMARVDDAYAEDTGARDAADIAAADESLGGARVSPADPYVAYTPAARAWPQGSPVGSAEQADIAAAGQTVVRQQAWQGSRHAGESRRSHVGRAAAYGADPYGDGGAASPSSYGAGSSKRSFFGSGGSGADGSGSGSGKGSRARRPRAPKRSSHGCLSFFLWLAMVPIAALMAARMLPADMAAGRAIPEVVSFVPLLLIPLAIITLLAILWRRWVLIVVAGASLALVGWWHAGYFIPGERVSAEAVSLVQSASADDSAARITTLNTHNGDASAVEIVSIVRSRHVEVLCLQELTDGMLEDLEAAGISEVLPYHVVSTGASAINNGGRNGIWSLAPMSNVSRNLLPIDTSSMPAADIQIGGTTVRIVSVHPNSPVRGAQDVWEEGLSVIGGLTGYDHAYVVMGDFNSTWDHARFRELLGGVLADAGESSGEGFHMTFPSNSVVPPLVEIDHIVYARDRGICVSELETVAVAGTDHMALIGVLEAE